MKRTGEIVLAVMLICVVLAYSSMKSDYDDVLSERNALKAQIAELTKVTTQNVEGSGFESVSNPVENSEDEKLPELGSRKNPAQIGDVVVSNSKSNYGSKCDFELTLVDVKRGEDVAYAISEANSFNQPAPEGKEYIIATFSFKNTKNLSDEDEPYSVNSMQFSYCSADFAKEDQWNSVYWEPELRAEVFEDGSVTGDVILIGNEGEECYAVYKDEYWFYIAE